MRGVLALVVSMLLLVLSGCGTADVTAGDGSDVDDRTFLSTEVTRDGESHALVDGSRVRISFADDQVSVQAGCNTLFGGYAVQGGVLSVNGMGGTQMGCPPELVAQDAWLVRLLEAGPSVEVQDDTLTLTGNATVITFVDREVADPDRPLVGTVWRVDSLVEGDAVSSAPGRAAATLTFGDDGIVELLGSCNQGSADYQLTEGEKHLLIGDLDMTAMACDEERGELERAVLELLRAGELSVDINADTLTLTAGDEGLVLREL